MANICTNTITVIGLQEAPEVFLKALSLQMFGIDLDNMDPRKWGEDADADGKTWYSKLADDYRREGARAARYCVLYQKKPYQKFGVTAPRYYVETKWSTPSEKVADASKAFPELTIHVSWWVQPDGAIGEYLMKDGQLLEHFVRQGSWYLFDRPILYPTVSLLSAHMPFTLPQHAALRVEDAIQMIEGLRGVLDDERFVASPYHAGRDRVKLEQTKQALDGLLERMQDAAKQLDFERVLLGDSQLQEALKAEHAETERLANELGLKFIAPRENGALRFALLPVTAAVIDGRCIAPVVRYTNCDPITGKYVKDAAGNVPSVEFEVQFVFLTELDVRQIIMQPDENSSVYDVDIAMTQGEGRPAITSIASATRPGGGWTPSFHAKSSGKPLRCRRFSPTRSLARPA